MSYVTASLSAVRKPTKPQHQAPNRQHELISQRNQRQLKFLALDRTTKSGLPFASWLITLYENYYHCYNHNRCCCCCATAAAAAPPPAAPPLLLLLLPLLLLLLLQDCCSCHHFHYSCSCSCHCSCHYYCHYYCSTTITTQSFSDDRSRSWSMLTCSLMMIPKNSRLSRDRGAPARVEAFGCIVALGFRVFCLLLRKDMTAWQGLGLRFRSVV